METKGLNFRLLDYQPFPIAVRKQTTAGLSDSISLDPMEGQISPATRISCTSLIKVDEKGSKNVEPLIQRDQCESQTVFEVIGQTL